MRGARAGGKEPKNPVQQRGVTMGVILGSTRTALDTFSFFFWRKVRNRGSEATDRQTCSFLEVRNKSKSKGAEEPRNPVQQRGAAKQYQRARNQGERARNRGT